MAKEPCTVVGMTPAQLRRFISSHQERDYLLVDVRQPEEFEDEHLPGARLVPMMEIEDGSFSLPPAKNTIFYCRIGNRSRRAASLLARSGREGAVYILLGGILAWTGRTLPDFPDLRAFDDSGSLDQVLRRAMDLEKGAWRLYRWMAGQFSHADLLAVIDELARSEQVHARALYDMLELSSSDVLESFEQLHDSLKGDLLESGESLEQVLGRLESHAPADLLELGLEMELRALDLYRDLAELFGRGDLRDLFLELAEHEKQHARSLLGCLGTLKELVGRVR